MLVTTSRNSSLKTKEVALSFSIKNSYFYFNRGKHRLEKIISTSIKKGEDTIVLFYSKSIIHHIKIINFNSWEWID